MNTSVRYPQPTAQALVAQSVLRVNEQTAAGQSTEINRLLTAAVVNRRFCRLLLTNPLAAVAAGYRGESFHLNSEELQCVGAIRATSLRDFAYQLLSHINAEENNKVGYEGCQQPVALALSCSSV